MLSCCKELKLSPFTFHQYNIQLGRCPTCGENDVLLFFAQYTNPRPQHCPWTFCLACRTGLRGEVLFPSGRYTSTLPYLDTLKAVQGDLVANFSDNRDKIPRELLQRLMLSPSDPDPMCALIRSQLGFTYPHHMRRNLTIPPSPYLQLVVSKTFPRGRGDMVTLTLPLFEKPGLQIGWFCIDKGMEYRLQTRTSMKAGWSGLLWLWFSPSGRCKEFPDIPAALAWLSQYSYSDQYPPPCSIAVQPSIGGSENLHLPEQQFRSLGSPAVGAAELCGHQTQPIQKFVPTRITSDTIL